MGLEEVNGFCLETNFCPVLGWTWSVELGFLLLTASICSVFLKILVLACVKEKIEPDGLKA